MFAATGAPAAGRGADSCWARNRSSAFSARSVTRPQSPHTDAVSWGSRPPTGAPSSSTSFTFGAIRSEPHSRQRWAMRRW